MTDKSDSGTVQYRAELILALIITGLACVAGFSNYLSISTDLYPLTSDAMGHMAKVRYLAESLAKGEFPSWFPYWYNGSAFTQYYPPLSYWIMAPIFMMVKNAMLTYKINCFIMIFAGGMGVWYFCSRYIGRWCGLFGTVAFCLQPYILLTFYGAGLLAQGPIIALTPWYLIAVLSFAAKPDRKRFFLCTLLCALMILSHPMTIFMTCMCVAAVLFVMALLREIPFHSFFFVLFSIVFAGVLTAFWSLVGVTGLETPGVPYLLPEAAIKYTADFSWFTTVASGFFYFAIPVSIGCIAGLLLFAFRLLKKYSGREERFAVIFCILLTLLTTVFSFGMRLPLFRYLPLAESYVPGRILGLTAVTGAVLCSYFIYEIWVMVLKKRMSIRIPAALFCFVLMGTLIFYMNPLQQKYLIKDDRNFNEMFSKINTRGSSFEKGRYADIGLIDSSETYFPLTYGYNITFGWNIEGTPHNRFFWNQSIAQATGNYDYLAKTLAYWNVRTIYAIEDFKKVIDSLNKKYQYKLRFTRESRSLYVSDDPSSYFMADKRNALLLGAGSQGMAMEFPYLVHEQRNDITDYTLKELEPYKVIYLCEPEVGSRQHKDNMERIITELADRGTTVLIEPAQTKNDTLFGVIASDIHLENQPVVKKIAGAEIEDAADSIKADKNLSYARVLFGLDKAYYELQQNGGSLKNDVLGIKKVGKGTVVFVGMHLSQYLKAVYAANWGVQEEGNYPESSEQVKKMFEALFGHYGVVKDFWPEDFPVKNTKWTYRGVDFDYISDKARQITLSITYTPRWKAEIDGHKAKTGQRENLTTLELPAGMHHVRLIYGITKFGAAGYAVSLVGLLTFLLILKYFDIILIKFKRLLSRLRTYLQLNR